MIHTVSTLLSVKCALPFSPMSDQLAHKASAPLTLFVRCHSLGYDGLKVEGASHVAEMLKANKSITSIK